MAEVLIVGAGPTGLALACGLWSAGVPARVVDAADGPAVTSRALGLQPRGVEVLDRLGALGDLPDRALHMAGTSIRVDGKERLKLALPDGETLGSRTALVISQVEIEAGLRKRLAELGGKVEWGRKLTEVAQHADAADVTFEDGTTCRTDWLVGCDGAHSGTRKAIGVHLTGKTAVERFLLADVQLRLPVERGFASMWLDENGALATIPLPGTDSWRLMAPIPPDQPDTMPSDAIVELLTRSLRDRVGERAEIEDVTWTSTFRIHRRLADTYRQGRVLLAGDAVHINSPVGGQGMNTGIGDAENLAWKLALVAGGQAGPGLLDSYQAERRPVAEAVVNTVGGIDTIMLAKNPLITFVRDRVLLPVVNRPGVQRKIWHKASQLGITYRNGPLAQHHGWGQAQWRSGDRVADLRCQRTDNTDTRLHAELGGRWALLSAPDAPTGSLAELTRARLGSERLTELRWPDAPSDSAQLVRPDAHLGWHGGSADLESLTRWLNGVVDHESR